MEKVEDFKKRLSLAKEHLLKNDKILKPIIIHFGDCGIRQSKDHLKFLIEAIISQQLSSKAADTILKRFLNLFEKYPTAEDILKKKVEEMRPAGLSNAKARYLLDLSTKVMDKTINLRSLNKLSDEEVIEHLTQVKGIGRWTAEMVLIFSLGRLNVLPVDDQGIKNGIKKLYNFSDHPKPEEMVKLSKKYKWHPYNSVACWYIWKSLELK